MPRPKLTPEIAYRLADRLYQASGECDARLESVIAQDPRMACWYAISVLKGPWPEAESVIVQDKIHSRLYKDLLRTPEVQDHFKEVQRCRAQS